jgi:hypothetical protein
MHEMHAYPAEAPIEDISRVIHNKEIDTPLDGINCTFSLELEWRDVFGAQVQCTCFGQRRFASTI